MILEVMGLYEKSSQLTSRIMILLTYIYIILAVGIKGTLCLRLLSLDVPAVVMKGDDIWLNCTLDLESDDLYSVKWYRDDVEFYRYLPQDSEVGQKYDLPGIHLDLEISVNGNVFLRNVNLETEGMYRCEASAESPTFQTVEGEKQIKVYVLPEKPPTIDGIKSMYEDGDIVNVTCKSGASKPEATLKWFVNEKEVLYYRDIDSPVLIPYPTNIVESNGLYVSRLGLTFNVEHSHVFKGDDIKLRCNATVSETYSTTSEELIVGNKPVGNGSPLNPFTSRDGPIITGERAYYRVGDMLDINCSSSKSSPAPKLQWFLNEEQVHSRDLVLYRSRVYNDGEEASVLGLRFLVQPRHLGADGAMRLRCTATLSKVINMMSYERTVGGNHRTSELHVAENFGAVTKRSSCAARLSAIPEFLLLFIILTYF